MPHFLVPTRASGASARWDDEAAEEKADQDRTAQVDAVLVVGRALGEGEEEPRELHGEGAYTDLADARRGRASSQ